MASGESVTLGMTGNRKGDPFVKARAEAPGDCWVDPFGRYHVGPRKAPDPYEARVLAGKPRRRPYRRRPGRASQKHAANPEQRPALDPRWRVAAHRQQPRAVGGPSRARGDLSRRRDHAAVAPAV